MDLHASPTSSTGVSEQWTVKWKSLEDRGEEGEETFDHLAITSGFFSRPHIPSIPGLDKFIEFCGEVYHSSDYADKISTSAEADTLNTIIVGGSLSAVEVTTDLSLHSPTTPLTHLFPRPFFPLPRHLPLSPNVSGKREGWFPLDLLLYNAATRRKGQVGVEGINRILRQRVGNGDLACLHPELAMDSKVMELPSYAAISDSYAGFARSGKLRLQRGYLGSIALNPETGKWDCVIHDRPPSQKGGDGALTKIIPDVRRLIFATGYTPNLQPFLPPWLLAAIGYDASNPWAPVSLWHQILNPKLARFSPDGDVLEVWGGFVGMYKGPYWGVMELQAKLLARLFSDPGGCGLNRSGINKGVGLMDEERRKRRVGEEGRRQWLVGDYVGEMVALEGFLERSQEGPSKRDVIDEIFKMAEVRIPGSGLGSVISAHFFSGAGELGDHHTRSRNRDRILEDLYSLLATAFPSTIPNKPTPLPPTTSFLPIAIFRSLHGPWRLRRTLTSSLPSSPSGTFVGTAEWVARPETFDIITPDGKGDALSCSMKNLTLTHKLGPGCIRLQGHGGEVTEYVYQEQGTFTLAAPMDHISFPAKRRYIWRLNTNPTQPTSTVSVWFVKPTAAKEEEAEAVVDYLFHELEFPSPTATPDWPSWAGEDKPTPPGRTKPTPVTGEAGEAREGGEEGEGDGVVVGPEYKARGKEHLCEKDLYKARYRFAFGSGAEMEKVGVGYEVVGPRKGYVSWGVYERNVGGG